MFALADTAALTSLAALHKLLRPTPRAPSRAFAEAYSQAEMAKRGGWESNIDLIRLGTLPLSLPFIGPVIYLARTNE